MPTVSKGLPQWLFQGGTTIEDFADRLNHFWTFGLLLLMAVILATRQVIQEPIHCWAPAQFSDSMAAWTKSHCWNSHFIQLQEDRERFMPSPHFETILPLVSNEYRKNPSLQLIFKTSTTVYQWIPLILFFQALAFKFPNVLFYLVHGFSGFSFDKLAGLTRGYEKLQMLDRNVLTRKISGHLYDWCNQVCFVLPWRLLTVAWLLTKIMYCINIGLQFRQMDLFIRTRDPPFDNSTSYGDVILDNLFNNNGSTWKTSPVFPRRVFCEFDIHGSRNVHNYLVMCDLPMNEFTELTFMLLWVWFLFVAIVTSLSLVTWLIRIFIPIFRQRYILTLLKLNEEFANVQGHELSSFANWIGEDCVMALKLISSNSSALVASDVVCHMWKKRQQVVGGPHYGETQAHGYQPVHAGPSEGPHYHMQSIQAQPITATAPPLPETEVGYPPSCPSLDLETKI